MFSGPPTECEYQAIQLYLWISLPVEINRKRNDSISKGVQLNIIKSKRKKSRRRGRRVTTKETSRNKKLLRLKEKHECRNSYEGVETIQGRQTGDEVQFWWFSFFFFYCFLIPVWVFTSFRKWCPLSWLQILKGKTVGRQDDVDVIERLEEKMLGVKEKRAC